jgi:hypothetical protein
MEANVDRITDELRRTQDFGAVLVLRKPATELSPV